MQENNIPVNQSISNPVIQSVSNPIPANDNQPKTNSFLVVLLSVLLFISVAIAGFFAFQTQKLVKELTILKGQEKVVVPTTEPIATDSATINTSNWKIFTDVKNGFLFKYPSEWYVITSTDSFVLLSNEKEIANTSVSFSISTENISTKESVDSYFDQMIKIYDTPYKEEIIKSKKIITLDNVRAIRHENYIDTVYKGRLYQLKIINNGDPLEMKISDQILSTFKFLD